MAILNNIISKILIFTLAASIATALRYVAPQPGEQSRTYAQYQQWNALKSGALTLEFKTSQPSGLLAYLDDGGDRDYLALQLENGRAKLSFTLANLEIQFTVGENLNNSSWHTVTVYRNYSSCKLKVDSQWKERESTGTDFMLTTKSDLYLGGLPTTKNPDDLTTPRFLGVKRFVGKIRNVFYKNDTTGRWVTPKLLDSIGVQESGSDQCSTINPCLNDGRCISSDRGSACNCSLTNYSGEICAEVETVSIPSCPYESLCGRKLIDLKNLFSCFSLPGLFFSLSL
ncbi:neurexin-3-like isoform X2 [Antedon mediterranea]|uniref:neurexin-3-like isoform X2 n=1 Tax=Antedon mediterranea TaxID=105859 RepID=UPI003AF45F0E